jgi:hypothetical protein
MHLRVVRGLVGLMRALMELFPFSFDRLSYTA